MSTKEKIMNAALSLFAKNGYDGTSVEQIAELVGIKAPSLYKHFKGKEDILNALIDIAEERYEENFGSEKHVGKIPDSIEEFIQSSINRTAFTISDPMIRNIRTFLVKEQFRNERIALINTRHQIHGPQKMYTKIVAGMIEKGQFEDNDPELMALEFISPVSLLISRADREPEYEKEALDMIKKHLRHLCDVYRKD
ncbi:MAG: TetR/AcrR family transcriptional regulator [Erysipelotrichaceae bacterium]|nr:TetR/AcrR family transcriptional regulator [Erysipelotrichaceae bacterium]